MIDPPKYAPTTGERCHHRDEQAQQFLDGRKGAARTWSRFHLWLANAADTSYAVTNNEYLAGGLGAAIGLCKGIMIGIPLAFFVALLAPPLIAVPAMLWMGNAALAMQVPALLQAGTLMTGAFFSVKEGFSFFREAQKDCAAEKAGKWGDEIAAKGKAIAAETPSKVKEKAIERLKEEGAIGHTHKDPEPPEKGDNHRYALLKQRQAALAAEGKGL
jgi:hypothetical protein